jgi:hypothetical protein
MLEFNAIIWDTNISNIGQTSIKIKKCWYFVFRKSEEFLHSTKIIRISFHYWSFIQNDKKTTLFCYLHLEFTFLQVFFPPIFSPLLLPFLEGKTKIEIFDIKHCVNLNWRVYIVCVLWFDWLICFSVDQWCGPLNLLYLY